MFLNVSICLTSANVSVPKYATPGSAGMDLHAYLNTNLILKPLERVLVPTGIKIAIPKGYEAQIRPRSGLSIKNGITVINAPGTIDSDYRGEIMVPIVNISNVEFTISHGMRVAQMVFAKHEIVEFAIVDELIDNTSRGEDGFGSTGIK